MAVYQPPGNNSGVALRVPLAFAYDSQGRLESAVYTLPAGAVTVTYSYDAAGNRTSVVTQ